MSIDVQQFKIDVVRWTLQHLKLWSPAAERLMMGTAATESGFQYIRQLGNGPALGFFQVEPATRHDVHANFLAFRNGMRERVGELIIYGMAMDRQLVMNLAYSCAIARLVYYRKPEKLPDADNDKALANYWKRHYNTHLGAGTPEKFVAALKRFDL